mmetsp:Transcript_12211/g.32259  ORF Transcript_12211/g.32259 Transcript_12211/m.32259 type:complete len:219 (+) Transcript_12211:603-1259(+)
MLVHQRAAAVPGALVDGECRRRGDASRTHVRLHRHHRRIKAALVLRAHVHVDGHALQSFELLRLRRQARRDRHHAAAQLRPEHGEAENGVAAVADSNHHEAARLHRVLPQDLLAELVQVPEPVALVAAPLEQQGRPGRAEGHDDDPILARKAAAEAVHVGLLAAGDADEEVGRPRGVVVRRRQQLVLHVRPGRQLHAPPDHGGRAGGPSARAPRSISP